MTAEEYMMENMQGADYQEIEDALIGFAKLKCKELLGIVAKKANITFSNNKSNDYGIDVDSILNAVDLDKFIY